jgi:hypothetical protein
MWVEYLLFLQKLRGGGSAAIVALGDRLSIQLQK